MLNIHKLTLFRQQKRHDYRYIDICHVRLSINQQNVFSKLTTYCFKVLTVKLDINLSLRRYLNPASGLPSIPLEGLDRIGFELGE